MAAQVILIEAQPADVATGAAVAVRLAGGGAQRPYDYAGQADWRAGVAGLPTMLASLDYEGGELPSGSVPSAAAIDWAGSDQALLARLAGYLWADAPVTVRIGPESDALPPVALSGKALEAKVANGRLTIAMADPAAAIRKPLLTARFAGTGGLEGPPEWAGEIRRRVWGRVWNLAGDPIDPANNIYCFADPLRPIQAFDAVRDKGAPAAALAMVDWQGSAAATLAALQAAIAPQGGGVACPSIACVKWWTQPAGELCADLRGEIGTGYVETTAGIAQRLVEAIGGPAFAPGTIGAASVARPAPVGWVASDDSTTVAAMLDELLGNVSLLWLLDDAGRIAIRPWEWAAPVAAATSEEVERRQVLRPLATRRLGFRRNETRMARGDLAGIVLSTEVSYLDGTPIEALQPAEGGATRGAIIGGNLRLPDETVPIRSEIITGEGTAQAIVGQGPAATDPRGLDPLFNPAANLVYDAAFRLGGAQWTHGSEWAVYSGTYGEGAYAATVVGGTNVAVSPPFPVQPGVGLYLSLDMFAVGMTGGSLNADIQWLDSSGASIGYSARVTAVNGLGWRRYQSVLLVSPAGTASGRVRVFTEGASNTNAAFKLVKVSSVANAPFSDEATFGARYWGGPAIEDLRPAEIGANVTETRTAQAIANQGALATQNNVNYATQVTGSGRPETFVFGCRGNSSITPPGYYNGLVDAAGNNLGGFVRSYRVFYRASGSTTWVTQGFDVFGSAGEATAMANYLNAIPAGAAVVVLSFDEPQANRLSGGLPEAMYRCGASRSVFGRSSVKFRSAYALIGRAGIGEGMGTEFYKGDTDSDPNAWIMGSFSIVNGVPVVGYSPIRGAQDLVYPDGTLISDRQPAQSGADVTAQNTAAAIANQGALAVLNQVPASRSLIGSYDNIIPDNDYRDPAWWGFQGLPNVYFDANDGFWEQHRSIVFQCDRDFDISSSYFAVEPGSAYRVRVRIWNNDTSAGWTGAFWPLIHMPWVAWWSLKHGHSVDPNVADSDNAIVANGDTGAQEFYFLASSNTMRQIQFRFKSTARGSNVILQVQITKVPQLGKDLIRPGTATKYLTAEVETALGTAQAIVNQGAGATANTLAQLDATAAAQLTTALNGGLIAAGWGETLKRRIADGASINLAAQVSVAAGGSTAGTIEARIEVSPFGANSWTTVATGAGASVTPSEPGIDTVSGTYTNTTGAEQLFEFRATIVRTPGTAGGTVIASQSYVEG